MNTIYFTPLSLSQLLKEKGVKQESEHYWAKWPTGNGYDYVLSDTLEVEGEGEVEGYACYNLSELPDVFRQVFGKNQDRVTKYDDGTKLTMKITPNGEWEYFSNQYFKDPKTAWETLEKTIRELK